MIKFTKMHGIGNDYIYIDCIKQKRPQDPESLAKIMSNRKKGIGSDGLILIEQSNIADFKMEIFNTDGSQAQMCGNGIRCVGKYVYDKGYTTKETLTIETLAGIKTLELKINQNKVQTVKVDMGEPILDVEKIPVKSLKNPAINLKIYCEDTYFLFTCVSMGNPHAVTIVDKLENFPVEKYGPLLEKEEHFPEKANIEFVQIINADHIKMRVWERGSGETLACGTGACAAVVAMVINKQIGIEKNKDKEENTEKAEEKEEEAKEIKVTVELLGGDLEITWDKKTNHIYMEGTATTVYEGEMSH